MDCLGPFAKVVNCPVKGRPGLRLTAYATGYADSFFSVPACTRYRGKHVRGYFTTEEAGVVFVPMDSHADRLEPPKQARYWLRLDSDHLERAVPYLCKADALAVFQEEAQELARYGQTLTASLHIAPSRSELAEYPDFVLSLGPRGGLQCAAA